MIAVEKLMGCVMRRIEITVKPPTWVDVVPTVSEWAGIARVRVISARREGQEAIFTIEGQSSDIECFKRIVRLNTKNW